MKFLEKRHISRQNSWKNGKIKTKSLGKTAKWTYFCNGKAA